MVAVEELVEQTLSKVWVGCCLHKGPDEQGQCSHFDMKETKSTIFSMSVEYKLTWLFKAVLIEPRFDVRVDRSDVLNSQIDTAAFEPYF